MIEVTDDMANRLLNKQAALFGRCESLENAKLMLQAALDNRVGETDRRKVIAYRSGTRRDEFVGRRSNDKKDWRDLPLATEPEIPVSEGMVEAGRVAYCESHGFNPKAKSWLPNKCVDDAHAAVYRAMEAKRREGDPI